MSSKPPPKPRKPTNPARRSRRAQSSSRTKSASGAPLIQADRLVISQAEHASLLEKNQTLAAELKDARDRLAATTERVREQLALMRTLSVHSTLAEEGARQELAHQYREHLQQLLVALKFKLTGLARTYASAAATDVQWRDLTTLVDLMLSEFRRIGGDLGPHVLEFEGLIPRLQWLTNWMRERYGFTLELSTPEAVEVGPDPTRTLLFSAIRHMVLNAAKHAQVKTARVAIVQQNGTLRVTVQDDGIGFDPASLRARSAGGLGLVSVRQTVDYLGGTLEIASAPGQGTRATLTVPLPA